MKSRYMNRSIDMNHSRSTVASIFAALVLSLTLTPASDFTAVGDAHAQPDPDNEAGAPGFEGESGFDIIFHRHYPGLECRDAPTVLNGSGITVRYGIIEFPYGDDRTWEIKYRRLQNRPRGEMIKTFPTLADMRYLLSLSDLDMSEILKYDELLAAGNHAELLAILTRLIDPRMDKYNRKELEGFDPNLCVNDARNFVYSLRLDESVLDDIRDKKRLFHRGEYEKYRSDLMDYLDEYPKMSGLHEGIGNSFFAEGNLEKAREWFTKGLSANPLNPMLEYSLAFCHLMEGDVGNAIESLIASIFACRNNMLSWLALEHLLAERGQRIADRRFKNMTLVDAEGGNIWISKSVSPGVIEPWLYYGAAEIATEHERGRRFGNFGNWKAEVVDYYRVAHLLGKYMLLKGENGNTYDPYLESLESIYRSGLLKEYVLFDKVAPYMQYYLISILPEDDRLRLREYFDRYIISG